MITAKDLMIKDFYSIEADTKVRDLLKLFVEKQVSGVPVVNKNNELAGIITESDILRGIHDPPSLIDVITYVAAFDSEAIISEEINALLNKPVNELMTRKVVTFRGDERLSIIARVFSRNKFKKIPVVSGQKLVGVVSRGDIMRYLVKNFII